MFLHADAVSVWCIESWLGTAGFLSSLKDQKTDGTGHYGHSGQNDFNASRLDDPFAPATTGFTFSGTSKATHHLPKYCGHIPANTSNVHKAKHSSGEEPRQHLSDLRLTTSRMGSAPGYTGYIPFHTGLSSDRTTGCHPSTTTGAAYSGKGISLL